MKIRKMFLVLIAVFTLISAIPKGNANGIASSSLKNFIMPKLSSLTNSAITPGAYQRSGLYTARFTERAMNSILPFTMAASLAPITRRAEILRVDAVTGESRVHELGAYIYSGSASRASIEKALMFLEADISFIPQTGTSFKQLLADTIYNFQYALEDAQYFNSDLVLPYLAILDAMISSQMWISSKMNSLSRYNDESGFQQFCLFLKILEILTATKRDARSQVNPSLALNNGSGSAITFEDNFLEKLSGLNEQIALAYSRAKTALENSGTPDENDLLIFDTVSQIRDSLIHLTAHQSVISASKSESKPFMALAGSASTSIALFLSRLGAIDEVTTADIIRVDYHWFRGIEINLATAYGGLRPNPVDISIPLRRVQEMPYSKELDITPEVLMMGNRRF